MKERKQNITIRIADVAPLSLTISLNDEEIVRHAERQVNKLWSQWSSDFSIRSSKEVLAMVAYQFARRYYELLGAVKERDKILNDFEAELDRLLEIGESPVSALHRDVTD
ncbi:MAG: cell division protein ZapA [Muribaculaceae bacterium]|nr:cell division protein ZapA [Muribaculaceae bacterium]